MNSNCIFDEQRLQEYCKTSVKFNLQANESQYLSSYFQETTLYDSMPKCYQIYGDIVI